MEIFERLFPLNENRVEWGTRLDTPTHTLNELCREVEYVGPVGTHPHAMPFEQRMGIYVCRGLTPPLEALWPMAKKWM